MNLLSRISISATNKGRISNKAGFAFVFYLMLPVIAIMMIISSYPELSSDRLLGILARIIPISLVLIAVSQFQVRYEKGSRGRFILNEVYVIMVIVWIFALLGGQPVIHQSWGEYSFSLHIWNYLALIMFITVMNIIYYAVEYAAYSKKKQGKYPSKHNESGEKAEITNTGVIITSVSPD